MTKRIFTSAVLILTVALLMVSSSTQAKERPENTFVLAIASDISTLDPNHVRGWASRGVWAYIYQPLIFVSGIDRTPLPGLAESWDLVNPTTWKFKIRKGVKFENGRPFTAADAKYSIDRILRRVNKRYPGFATKMFGRFIDQVETPDDYTLVITTKYPEITFIHLISAIFLVSETYVEEVGDKEMAKNPIGTGPFKFVERQPSESITLNASEGYWNTNPAPGTFGPPKIDRVVMRIIPEMQTRIAALKAKEVDGNGGIQVDAARELEKNPEINLFYTVDNSPQMLLFNWRADKDPKTGKPNPFKDVRVRRALNHAIDVPTLIKNYLTGRELRATLIGSGAVGYNPDVPFYEYNLEKARQLLTEAGYPKGFEFTFHTIANMPPVFQAIHQYWRDAGLKVNLRVTTVPVIVNEVIRKKLYGVVNWSAGRGRETAKQFFDSTMRYNGIWSLHAKDERVEALVEKQGKEFDQEKRAALIHEVVKILWKDAWFVPLWEPVVIKAIRKEWEYEDWPAALSIYLTNLSRKK
ncbi:MAG: hypothetical protein JRI95_13260 [Deltaproteobacteria bacterium]|nr:hypothetical protein [Deltaproteobacteria bacterium]